MLARRRIGHGLVVSVALHAAAAALALWLAVEAEKEDPPIELELADIELLDDEPTPPPDPVDPVEPPDPAPPAPPAARPAPPEPSADPLRMEAERPPVPTEPTPSPTMPAPPSPTEPTPAESAPTPPSPAERPPSPTPPPEPTPSPTPPAASAEIATGSGQAQPEASAPGTWSGPPGGSPDPGRPPSLDPRTAVEGLALDPGPPPPRGPLDQLRLRRPPRPRSELRPDGAAGYRTDEGVFVARTAPDGTVRFEDRPNIQIRIPLPTPTRVATVVENWYDALAPGRAAARAAAGDAAHPRVELDGDGGGVPVLAGGSFDVTDGIMRGAGQDPYAARKLDFLDRTRDQRMRLAAGEKSARLREALHRTRGDLERLWRGPGTPAEKRELIFLLWDECVERGTDEELRIARAIRGTIGAFVRRRLPAGRPDAYRQDELTRLNARRTSTARFAPYD